MTSSLQLLFETIDRIESEPELRSQVLPEIGAHFNATRRGIFYFDTLEQMLRERLPSIDSPLETAMRTALSIEHNPIARYLTEHHAPVHEALVTTPKIWTAICPRPDHWHVMAGPIVSHSRLVGLVACTREKSMSAFNSQNLTDLSGICLHLSVWTATVRSRSVSIGGACPGSLGKLSKQTVKTNCLTPRELQIVEQVALGKTNAGIGKELWITENSVKKALKRMFVKLNVSSRAEMISKLSNTRSYEFEV
jgi:DNA-binding CsgD family transcriptional regulator